MGGCELGEPTPLMSADVRKGMVVSDPVVPSGMDIGPSGVLAVANRDESDRVRMGIVM
jgi:hypothetical protein